MARNIWNLYVEITYFGFVFGILQTFLSVYVIRLGANNTVIGLLNALPSLVFAVWSIPAARLVEQNARRMRLILISGSLHRLGVAALGLMPFVVVGFRPEAAVIIVTLMTIPQVVANIGFSSMFADVVPADYRARTVAVRSMLLGITMTLASYLGGQFLGLSAESYRGPLDAIFAFPLNYQFLFIFGFGLSLAGMVYLSRVRVSDGERASTPRSESGGGSLPSRLRAFVALIVGEREFSRYTLAMFILHWGLFLPIPLYSLYWVRTLHASDSFVGLILTVQNITTIVVYPLLPGMARRMGNRGLLALAALLISLYPLITAFVTTLEPLLLISVIGGAGGAMFGLASFNLLLEVSPAVRRPSFIATFNSAAFTAGFIAPFLGTELLNFIDINQDLFFGGVLRLLGFLALILLVGVSGKPGRGGV
ncbi:MAG: MFS transporter [Chloroflexi bacterium]|nr:MFS transporter [Chloroflexota bacterium]